jgi:hypothetical protein
MAENNTPAQPEQHKQIMVRQGGGSNAVYGIGLIGAWVYYFKCATTDQERIRAFFKGLFWPAFLVYDLLVFLSKKETPLNSSWKQG